MPGSAVFGNRSLFVGAASVCHYKPLESPLTAKKIRQQVVAVGGTGNNLIMPGSDFDRNGILAAIADGRLSAKITRRCACRVLRLMLNANVDVRMGEQL